MSPFFVSQEIEHMSDALTTDSALATASPDGGQPGQASAEAQAESGKQESKRVNLHDLPEFREVQSKYDRERAQLQQQVQQQNQVLQQLQRQMAEAEDRAAPDDYTRLELRLQREQREKAALQQQLQQAYEARQAEQARDAALTKIATKYGVPRAELDSATNYEEAADLAIAYISNAKQRRQQEEQDKAERNRPDVGGGKTSTRLSRLEQEYVEAQQKGDSVAMARIRREYEAERKKG